MNHFDKISLNAAHWKRDGAIALERGSNLASYKMIHGLDIQNFRCFSSFNVPFCSRINVIVGDNGVGKTALLEAIFLALGVSSELGARFRSQRGSEAHLMSNPHAIEDALFGDLFYKRDMSKPIRIRLAGDGRDQRSVEIKRQEQPVFFAPNPSAPFSMLASSLVFEWVGPDGQPRQSRINMASDGQVQFNQTGENNDNNFYFAANQNIPSAENAMRFSMLSQNNKEQDFIKAFTKQFDWVQDISIEISGGYPSLFATVRGQKNKLPVVNVSGAVNRTLGILLAMASSPKGAVLADELENGIFYSHHETMWRTILDFSKQYECQLFTTTHSMEWLNALVASAGDDLADISLWRITRGQEQPQIKQFSGKTLRIGIESGGEVR